jgi:DNA-directed RNA polymerase specialized sigma24 family protein
MQTTSAIRIGPGHPVWDGLNDPDVRQRLTAIIKAALRKGTSPAAQRGAEWDEVLSDVCERALRIADQYDPTRKPVLSWLGGIAFVVMRERRPRRLTSGVDVSTSPDPADPIPDAVLSRLEAVDLVRRLPPDLYQLLLWDAEDRTSAEIAQDLGISAGAVRVRIHRARESARILLGPAVGGEGAHD